MSYEAKWDNKSNVKLDTRYLTPKSQQIHLHYFAFLLPSTLILVSRTFSVLFDYFLMCPASPSVPLPDAPCRFRVFALLSFRTPQDVSKRDKRPCCITSSAMQSGGSTRHHQKIRETQTLLQITGKGWKALCCTISCGWWFMWEKNMFQTLGITWYYCSFQQRVSRYPFCGITLSSRHLERIRTMKPDKWQSHRKEFTRTTQKFQFYV